MMKRLWVVLLAITLLITSGCGKSTTTVNDPSPYIVSGKVTTSDGQGVPDVVIVYAGLAGGTVRTDSEGKWSATVKGNAVPIQPTRENWSFEPNSKQVYAAASDVNFVGTDQTYTLSGIVHDSNGIPISGVTLSFTGYYDDKNFGTVITSSDGKWSRSGLIGSIKVKTSKNGWTFNPSVASFSKAVTGYEILGSLSNAIISATPSSADLGLYINNSVTLNVTFKDASGNNIDSAHPVWSVKRSSCVSNTLSTIGTLNSTQGHTVTFTAREPGSGMVCIDADPYFKEIPITVTAPKPLAPRWNLVTPTRTGATKTEVWVELNFEPTTKNDDGSSAVDLAGYRIYTRTGSTEPYTYVFDQQFDDPNNKLILDGSLRGFDRTFVVVAVDKWGNKSNYSLPQTVHMGGYPPQAPTNISLTNINENGSDKIRVTWDAVIADTQNKLTTVTQYRIFRGTDSINLVPIQTVNQIGTGVQEWIDSGVERGKTYYYALTAIDSNFNESSRSYGLN